MICGREDDTKMIRRWDENDVDDNEWWKKTRYVLLVEHYCHNAIVRWKVQRGVLCNPHTWLTMINTWQVGVRTSQMIEIRLQHRYDSDTMLPLFLLLHIIHCDVHLTNREKTQILNAIKEFSIFLIIKVDLWIHFTFVTNSWDFDRRLKRSEKHVTNERRTKIEIITTRKFYSLRAIHIIMTTRWRRRGFMVHCSFSHEFSLVFFCFGFPSRSFCFIWHKNRIAIPNEMIQFINKIQFFCLSFHFRRLFCHL